MPVPRPSQFTSLLQTQPASLKVTLPDSAAVELLSTIQRQLGGAGRYRLDRLVDLEATQCGGHIRSTISKTPENWKNTWNFALGAN